MKLNNSLTDSDNLIHLSISYADTYFFNHFPKFPNLMFLSLKHNNLFHFPINYSMNNLQSLILSNNPLQSLDSLDRVEPVYLLHLDVSHTNIKEIQISTFQKMTFIVELILSNTSLQFIEKNSFSNLNHLQVFFINRTKLKSENYFYIFNELKIARNVSSDDFRFCCLLWRFVRRNIDCVPDVKYFFTCNNLISSLLKRGMYWFLGVVGFLGNTIALILLMYAKSFKQKYQFLLIFGDILVSIYLLSIAFVDLYYGNDYLQNDYIWRSSVLCHVLESLMTFSLMLSCASMCLITMERYLIVASPIKRHFLVSNQFRCLIIVVLSCLSISILQATLSKVSFMFSNLPVT